MKQVSCLMLALLVATATGAPAFGEDLADRVNALENTVRSQEKTIEEQQKQIDSLKRGEGQQPNALTQTNGGNAETPPPPQGEPDLRQKVEELNDKVEQVVEAQKKEIPSVFNPAIGLVGETIFSYRSKGSDATGRRSARRVRRFPALGRTGCGRIGGSVRHGLRGHQRIGRRGYSSRRDLNWPKELPILWS